MNTQLKQQIDEQLEHLSDLRMAEVLDFVEFLNTKEHQAQVPLRAGGDTVQNRLKTIVTTPPANRLSALKLDLSNYKFDRDEANAR